MTNKLIEAADELAEAVDVQWTVFSACPRLIEALTAYRAARESAGEVEDYRSALELLINKWEFSEHEGCGCMGPRKGHDLCHCKERVIVLRYMKESLCFLQPRSAIAGG